MIKHTFTVPGSIQKTALMPLARRMLPTVPEYAIRQAFKNRDVKMNGARAGSGELATAGALVEIYLPDQSAKRQIETIYEDENVIVVYKPCGVSCQADAKGGAYLPELISDKNPPLLCHRLDNPTDGLLILAKDARAQSEIALAFRQRRVYKRYECLVMGEPPSSRDVLSAYLTKRASDARVTVSQRPGAGALPIKTGYRVMSAGDVSRLEIELYTGRTHQIRAHMAHIGNPVLGDDIYGDREFNRRHRAKRLMLTATDIALSPGGELEYLRDKRFHIEPRF